MMSVKVKRMRAAKAGTKTSNRPRGETGGVESSPHVEDGGVEKPFCLGARFQE